MHDTRNSERAKNDLASSVSVTGSAAREALDARHAERGPIAVQSADEIARAQGRALTARQRAVLDWIRGFMIAKGYAPSLREIGAAFGIRSTNGVNDHLRALERKGWIRRDMMLSRSIVITSTAPSAQALTPGRDDIVALREENRDLREMLRRMHYAVSQQRPLATRLALLLGDVRAVLDGGGA